MLWGLPIYQSVCLHPLNGQTKAFMVSGKTTNSIKPIKVLRLKLGINITRMARYKTKICIICWIVKEVKAHCREEVGVTLQEGHTFPTKRSNVSNFKQSKIWAQPSINQSKTAFIFTQNGIGGWQIKKRFQENFKCTILWPNLHHSP